MIVVLDYDPIWADVFADLRDRYAKALDNAGVAYVSIEHVGSTSVPGLAAKPVIDLDIVVTSADMERASSVLEDLGFTPRGDLGIFQRLAFFPPADFPATHTYVVDKDSRALRNHLALRDTLRNNADLRDEYAQIKKRLATETDDIDIYVSHKSDIIQRILDAAGISPEERAEINTENR